FWFKISSVFFLFSNLHSQNWTIETMADLPEAVSNNAVCEGFIEDTAFVYSFGGIDASKSPAGIHGRAFRYNTLTDEWKRIADLPDGRGKIASGASRVGEVIYIIGGYYVANNQTEESSDRVHRYDVLNDEYLSDGAALPVPIDDHVQAVWRDSLIYVVTGWSDVRNVPDVQIYNPTEDEWMMGTRLLNSSSYTSFGASGAIVGDTIFYFGGATSGAANFPIQNTLRKGIINPDNPTEIEWSRFNLDNSIKGYRMACTTVGETVHWLGGSGVTYNFDGIAYNGSGGVEPLNRALYLDTQMEYKWQVSFEDELPMDLRGIASVNDTIKYLAGGMLANQIVTSQTYRLVWNAPLTNTRKIKADAEFKIYPNPSSDLVYYEIENSDFQAIHLYDIYGRLLEEQRGVNGHFSLQEHPNGHYFLMLVDSGQNSYQIVVKQ
ncbi:MAG: kelch repeat-containing protein, partial [Bacteroidota bacterium]